MPNELGGPPRKVHKGLGTFSKAMVRTFSPYSVGALLFQVLCEARLLKSQTPSRAVLRPRRRLNGRCAVDCASGGRGAIVTPVSLLLPPPGELASPCSNDLHATIRGVAKLRTGFYKMDQRLSSQTVFS